MAARAAAEAAAAEAAAGAAETAAEAAEGASHQQQFESRGTNSAGESYEVDMDDDDDLVPVGAGVTEPLAEEEVPAPVPPKPR